MRKIALLFVMAALVMACKSSNSMTAKPKETNVADKAIMVNGLYSLLLIANKVSLMLPY